MNNLIKEITSAGSVSMDLELILVSLFGVALCELTVDLTIAATPFGLQIRRTIC